MTPKDALAQYQHTKVAGELEKASSHKIVSLLMQGVIDKLTKAKGAMQRVEIEKRTQEINKSIDIIVALRSSLDMDAGQDLAVNLDSLYGYMIVTLMNANKDNSVEKADEVIKLMTTLKSGWDHIAQV